MRHYPLRTAFAALVLSLVSSVVQAQATRTWTSGVGDDANPCSRTAPCKTLAGTISKTAAGGEINILDPGGFGGVTITKSISIISEGFEAGVLVSGTNAIIVNAGPSDRVVLRGLDIEGLGTGLAGIKFFAGGSLIVEKCTINSFTQRGISFEPSGSSVLVVADTQIRNNTGASSGGILIKPGAAGQATVELNRVRLERNTYGMRIEDGGRATVRDSSSFANSGNGFEVVVVSVPSSLWLSGTSACWNTGSGVYVEGSGTAARIGNSDFTGNAMGLQIGPRGAILSFGGNRNDGNTTNGAPSGTVMPQ